MTDRAQWEPDARSMGNWREMFEPARPASRAAHVSAAPPPDMEEPEGDGPAPDPVAYRPWVLQRGPSRPAMMLHLRRYEPRSALWMGWAMPYPTLAAVEYVGDSMLSLDFGARQFVIQGAGLNELVGFLQQGSVLGLYEHSDRVWPQRPAGAVISSIRRVGEPAEGPGR